MLSDLFMYLVIATAAMLIRDLRSESDVGFPEREHIDIERNSTRVPLYIPGKCQQNQLLYPGDQKNDWICDCKPGYLYYAPMDGCYAAFRQGPCQANQYLTLEAGQFNPKCIANPCRQDGTALYKGWCYILHKEGGPCKYEAGGGIFGVNTSTLALECLRGTDRLSMMNDCAPGSQRDLDNRCTQIIQ